MTDSMIDLGAATRAEARGAWYQMLMFAGAGGSIVSHTQSPSVWVLLLSVPGLALFAWCYITLYARGARTSGLVTGGPFRFTRHPMYVGLFLLNLLLWAPPTLTVPFMLSQAAFLVGLVVAGYWQERETLARFGTDAVFYYARTPRLPFMV